MIQAGEVIPFIPTPYLPTKGSPAYFLTASVASTTSDASLLDQANGVKAPVKKEKPNGSVKLKKAIVKNAKPKVEAEGNGMPRECVKIFYI